MDILGRNIEFPIYNADGTAFNNLVMHKSTVESIVMSLGDKITGDVYYRDNTLAVTMSEYIVFNGINYVLVNPPTIVREGMVSDNGQLKGMTKYSFTFYHPMCRLGNIPFTDVAVTPDQTKYLSQNKVFSWIGTGLDFVDKLNKNLENTEWLVVTSTNAESLAKLGEMSKVLPFSENTIADALKTEYDTWKVPFVIDKLSAGEYFDGNDNDYYTLGKRFVIVIGLPANEILVNNEPFVFNFGKGVGLKNNSRTPRNNKIITRIAGYGSEENIPYGYPQVRWLGNPTWEYTINNDASDPNSYPIYTGIVGGQPTRLIKHPFTRNHLMPSVYYDTLFNKVSPYIIDPMISIQAVPNPNYDPTLELVDYYDADNTYPNPISSYVDGQGNTILTPSYESHQFEDIKPRLANKAIVGAFPYDDKVYMTSSQFDAFMQLKIANATNDNEKELLLAVSDHVVFDDGNDGTFDVRGGSFTATCTIKCHEYQDGNWYEVKYTSDNGSWSVNEYNGTHSPSYYVAWDDTMNDDGEYVQSYFKIRLPQLDFDLYASAAVTQEMQINMRSGDCLGCTFTVQVDWDDYKKNFYDSNGNFAPNGSQRNLTKYPKSNNGQIDVIVAKDLDTFGSLRPDTYRKPVEGDQFVILGISLPLSYITNAEYELDEAAKEYMLENNQYYYDYPLKFDEYFFATHTNILSQIRNNTIIRFNFGGEPTKVLYVKQMVIKYGDKPLPQYDITLADDIEVVLNQIGQVTDDVSRMRVQLSELQSYYTKNLIDLLNEKLSSTADDVAQGRMTFQQGLDSLAETIFDDEIKSCGFRSGLYDGQGWRVDELGNAEFESIRARSYLEVVELLVNRLQAQEGDTMYSDNDQIDKVQPLCVSFTPPSGSNPKTLFLYELVDGVYVHTTDTSIVSGKVYYRAESYILSLKQKWDGYITAQKTDNVIKGNINTLAAKQAGVSDVDNSTSVEQDGDNRYFTSWMRIVETASTTGTSLTTNQIRVVLYGDNETPARKNYEPCELMTIARWGCAADPNEPDISEDEKQDRIRRQRLFQISVTDGRVTKYTGVFQPILLNGNYGVTIGELPQFVKDYADVHRILEQVGEHTDWLFAQGIVVQNFVQVSKEGLPQNHYVDCGEWIDGSQVQNPTARHGVYLVYEFNEEWGQYETHDVWHTGHKWRCLQHQPVVVNGVATYYEPKWNSLYWKMIEGDDNLTLEFSSSNGYSFRRGFVNTDITPYIFYGGVDISDDIPAENYTWTRESESGKTPADRAWDAQHQYVKSIHLGNSDMPATWSTSDKAIFTCTVIVDDGKDTIIVENQIIS